MANLYLNLPVSAGPGVAVDVSALGKTKTVVIGGSFQGNILVEYATDLAGTDWAPVQAGGFTAPGRITLPLAAHWMRASSSGYSGAGNVDVGADDAGALFLELGAAPIDISSLPSFKTVVADGPCKVEVSEDGTSYSQAFAFQAAGGQSALLIAQFARVTGGAAAWIGGANDAGGGGGSTSLAVKDEGSAIGSFITMNFVGAGVTAANAGGGQVDVTIPGGGGAASQLLSIYGDGSFGDHTTAGDEAWSPIPGAPGAPVVPAGSTLPFAFFNNLTVSPGDSINSGVFIFVKGTLTIGAGGRVHVNGGDGGGPFASGGPGSSPPGMTPAGSGGAGNPAFASGSGGAGIGGSDRPAEVSAVMAGGAGGAGDIGLAAPGGAGGVCMAEPSWPYSLSQAIGVASMLYAVGGGNGGGGGGNGVSSNSGSGGGGGGVLVIFAKNIVAPAGSIQARGGVGGVGFSFELVPGGGGGGGSGGAIVIVTENATLAGVTDVSGGAGGAGTGLPFSPGAPGGSGQAVAFNPMLAALIPV